MGIHVFSLADLLRPGKLLSLKLFGSHSCVSPEPWFFTQKVSLNDYISPEIDHMCKSFSSLSIIDWQIWYFKKTVAYGTHFGHIIQAKIFCNRAFHKMSFAIFKLDRYAMENHFAFILLALLWAIESKPCCVRDTGNLREWTIQCIKCTVEKYVKLFLKYAVFHVFLDKNKVRHKIRWIRQFNSNSIV